MPGDFPANICIIEDDDEFGRYLSLFLGARGCRVWLYRSAEAYLSSPPDPECEFYLVDLGLPGVDGVDLLLMIRARSQAGIIVISGRMGPDAFNAALVAGADMYLNKPVRFDQVAQAIATVSRRLGSSGSLRVKWRLAEDQAELQNDRGGKVGLSPLETRLMTALIEAGERGCDRIILRRHAADPDIDDRTIDAAIFRLRKKIEKATGLPAPIKTRHGFGYAAAPEVSAVP